MYGNFSRSFDSKNRVLIPAKLRDSLGSSFFITIGIEKILELRDLASFELWKSRLLDMNKIDTDARNFVRLLLGNTLKVELDSLGRILLPESFLEQAGIATKEIVFVGMGDKVELWARDQYNNFANQFTEKKSVQELAKKLYEKGNKL